jgi:acyl-CoA hydrolase
MDYTKPASAEVVEKTIQALRTNGIQAEMFSDREELKKKVFGLISEGNEVMTMTSVTLDTLGISKEINESGKYQSVKKKLTEITNPSEKRKLGAGPDVAVGSVHAVTEDGHIVIASNTGSQLPAYAYGAGKVIWVVGTQKIVKDLDAALKRLYDYTLPLESERAKKAYGVPGSFVSKVLIVNKEVTKERVHLLFINESIGF